MSPLNSILVSGRRRVSAPAASGAAAACAALLLALTFAARVARASDGRDASATRDGDARRAEKVLSKLRLLYDAADADDADAYRALASKLYPDLFVKVAEMRPGDLSTDLSTAVFLAERIGRTWDAAGGETADCQSERPDIYRPICVGLRGGSVRQLLLAKSRLHARWAEALLRNGRGGHDAETARALSEMDAARAGDLMLAARVVEMLKLAEARSPLSATGADRRERLNSLTAAVDKSSAETADALHAAEVLLTWMPRSQTFYRLSSARLAYADGLWWYAKVRQSKSLVVSANGFAPDPLKELGLEVERVSATAQANWKTAVKYTRLAEQSLTTASR